MTVLEAAREFRRKAERLAALRSGPDEHAPEHAADSFDENEYLFFNPDVDKALREGRYRSAREHWRRLGWTERRPGGPAAPVLPRDLFRDELARRALGFNIYGHLSAASGLGGVARGMGEVAQHLGLPVNRIDVPRDERERPSPPDFTPHRVNLIHLPVNGFESFLRRYGTNLFNGAWNIGFWFWELPSARSDWYPFFRYVDEIWVASEFCRVSFQSLTNLNVVRMPLLIDGLEQRATLGRAHFSFSDEVFVFTYAFDAASYFSRKNPLCLVRAFRLAFGDSGRVRLFLKVSNSARDRGAMRQLREAVQGAPNIRIHEGLFTSEEMASLYRCADCLVSPHRSEGFGLNIAEAMYFGKPAIATGYSANLDFMNDGNGYLIDYCLAPIEVSEGPYWKGAVWAEPSEEHLRQLLQRVLDNPAERERKGAAAKTTIRERHNRHAVSSAVASRLRETGVDAPDGSRPEFRRHGGSGARRFFPSGLPAEAARRVLALETRPGVSFILPIPNEDAAGVGETIESVFAQWYPLWELCIASATAASVDRYRGSDARVKAVISADANKAVEMSTYADLFFLTPGDVLAPDALLNIVREMKRPPLASKAAFYERRAMHSS